MNKIKFETTKSDYFSPSFDLSEVMEIGFLENYISNVSYILNKTKEEIAVISILFLANAINNKLLVQHTENKEYLISSNSWGLLITEPGSGKSPLIRYYTKFLIEAENKYNQNREENLIIYEQVKKSIQKRPTQKNIEKLKEILNNPPKLNYLYVNNITKETLLKYLSFNEQGILLYFDELGSLFAKSKKDPEYRSLLLEGWNGTGTYKYTTLKDSTLYIKNFGIGIIANIQPSLFKKHFYNLEDGFRERFQILIPLSSTLLSVFNKSINDTILQKMQELFFRLTNPNLSQNFSTNIIKFSPAALARYIYFKHFFQEKFINSFSSSFRAYWAKIDKLILSISLVFFLLRFFYKNNKSQMILPDDLEKSLIVTKYLLHNFLTIETNLSINDDNLEKKVALKIFELFNNKSSISFRKVIQNIYNLHNNKELINILNKLKYKYPIYYEKNQIFLKT